MEPTLLAAGGVLLFAPMGAAIAAWIARGRLADAVEARLKTEADSERDYLESTIQDLERQLRETKQRLANAAEDVKAIEELAASRVDPDRERVWTRLLSNLYQDSSTRAGTDKGSTPGAPGSGGGGTSGRIGEAEA